MRSYRQHWEVAPVRNRLVASLPAVLRPHQARLLIAPIRPRGQPRGQLEQPIDLLSARAAWRFRLGPAEQPALAGPLAQQRLLSAPLPL